MPLYYHFAQDNAEEESASAALPDQQETPAEGSNDAGTKVGGAKSKKSICCVKFEYRPQIDRPFRLYRSILLFFEGLFWIEMYK